MKPLLFIAILLMIGIASATNASFFAISDAADAKISSQGTNAVFSTLRDGVGTELVTDVSPQGSAIVAGPVSGYAKIARYGWCGNTASLTASATVTGASFFVKGEASGSAMGIGNLSMGVFDFNPTDPTTLSMNDYNKTYYTQYSPYKRWNETWEQNGWNEFVLNASGISNVSRTGTTCVIIMTKPDATNTTTEISNWNEGGWSSAKIYDTTYAGTGSDPYLVVTYNVNATVTDATMEFNPSISGQSFGQVNYPNANFTTIRNMGGSWYVLGNAFDFVSLVSANTSEKYFRNHRTNIGFDTSALPENATIIDAHLSLYAHNAYQYQYLGIGKYGFTRWSPATNGSISVYSDYSPFGDTNFTTFVVPTANTRNNWTLNTYGLTNISKTGWTNYMVMSEWDFMNDTTGLTWAINNESQFRFHANSAGTIYKPVLSVHYNYTGAAGGGGIGAAFTTNQNLTVNRPGSGYPITFTDDSEGLTPTEYSIQYKDYSTLPMPFTRNWNTLNTSTMPYSYSWGAGNWSIIYGVKSGSWYYTTSPYWINITAGSTGGLRLSGTYIPYPEDSIWRQKVINLTKDVHSDTWMAQAYASSGSNTVGYYGMMEGAPYFVVNTTVVPQLYKNNNESGTYPSYYDYGSLGGHGGFAIPNDVTVQTGGSDHTFDLFDTTNGILYSAANNVKAANGTWTGAPTIFNLSSYCYRFSETAGGVDNGCTWLGNKWMNYATTNHSVVRKEGTEIFYPNDASIPPSLNLRYEEVSSGSINHTLFCTVKVAKNFIWPAIGGGTDGVTNSPPTGAIARIKQNYVINTNVSGTQARVIANGLKTYGCVVVNTGTGNTITVDTFTSPYWSSSDLGTLNNIHPTTDMEFVNASPLMISQYSTQAKATPVASFTQNVNNGVTPLIVTFTDTSTQGTSWSWNFGDGGWDTINQSATHTYTTTGNFTVTHHVCNSYGCDDAYGYVNAGSPSNLIAIIYHHLTRARLLMRLV